MLNQRLYIKASTRKQQNQEFDDFYGEIQIDNQFDYSYSLLQKRTQKEYLNEENKSKKVLNQFELSNEQWELAIQKNSQIEFLDLNNSSCQLTIDKKSIQNQKVERQSNKEDISVISINEINYLEQFEKIKPVNIMSKKKQNITKKIYKFTR